ncbi:MAG TPA: NAD(P)/FAD-dependent oxidoreductase [Actinomycetota bacterium]|nr:NAD(P)/FAD-dependent oxidoreductase [Actinomycetota bacterium]
MANGRRDMYDVIVVGARCAGSPTAMRLARAGHRVLLLDRASFPSDTMSTHFIQMPGMVRLQRWGLLDETMATGCPAITTGRITIDGQAAAADFEVPDSVPGLAAPRRTVLDKVLVDGAASAGAELREGAMVDELIFEGDRVVGVRGHDSTGTFEERARFVIGADGRHSVVARAVQPPAERLEPIEGGGFYSYWSGVDCSGAELFTHSEGFTVAFPTNDGLTTVAMVWPEARWSRMRKATDEDILSWLDEVGDIGGRVRAGQRAHQLIPVANLVNHLYRPWGPGWVLVGDAVYFKDPTPADGIADAYRSADLAADAVDDVLSGRMEETDALEAYTTKLNEAALPLLEKTIAMSDYSTTSSDRATAFFEIQALHLEEVVGLQNEKIAS